jgi:uncharacterized membrane protein YhaH (DUF805 family)
MLGEATQYRSSKFKEDHPMSVPQFAAVEPSYTSPSLGEFLFSFRGRISRYQYWVKFFLPYFLLSLTMVVVDTATGSVSQSGMGLFSSVFALIALWPTLAIEVKRCHDRDRSGWFLLISLIPVIGAIWLFVELGCLRGTIGGNRFGPDPVMTW